MKRLVLIAAMSAATLLVSACGDAADDDATAEATDSAMADGAAPAPTATVTTAAADWPTGTRIVEENNVTYRVNPDDTRVVIEPGGYRIATVDGVRYRVDASGTGHRIDDDGLDLDLPAVEGIDIDFGTNQKGNLDLDVSTDGTDASNDRGDDR